MAQNPPDPPYQVAILGTRFGSPDLEAEELAHLDIDFVLGSGKNPEEIAIVAQDAVAILAGAPPKFDRNVLSNLPNCRTIVRYGVGTETIDLKAATDLGIIVANVPDYCTEEVATHTLTLILANLRKLVQADAAVKHGNWQFSHLRPLYSTENQVLGIVGFGKIGQAVARKARPFGFEILTSDPFTTQEQADSLDVKLVELTELLKQADIISLNAPLTGQTYHLINRETISSMKDGAYLVNTSRGGLIDEDALEEALRQGKLAGAALDVLETEPNPKDFPLANSEQVILTPHMAWYTEQATVRMRQFASREVGRVLTGGWPLNLVNRDVVKVLKARKA
jgi:D-3-phosphoglycerate dehydrogenase